MLESLHVAAAVGTALCVAGVAVVVAWGRVRGRPGRLAADRLMLAALTAVAVGGLIGLALAAAGRGPRDGLHLLYAAAALVTLPIARFALPDLTAARRTWFLLAGCLVMAGLLLRLAQTG